MNYIAYDDATGRILRTGQCSADHVALQALEGETSIQDKWKDTDNRIHRIENGERVEFTPDPPAPLPIAAQRAVAMPPIPDQLDALWHAMDAGVLPMVPAFYDPIKVVKDALPKDAAP